MATATTASMTSSTDQEYDRLNDAKLFDDSKLGVKGLVDSGVASIPRFFIHPSETLSDLKTISQVERDIIPTIDLSGVDSNSRSKIVEQISSASREFGFFQIVNHGVSVEVMEQMIGGIKGLHEQSPEEKTRWYRRDMGTGVAIFSNFDLFHSKAASWRDTLQVYLGPTLPELQEIPEICRNELLEWNIQTKRVAELLMELLCEGVRLDAGRLKEMTCLEGRTMVGHYYPCCPQPDLTVGIASHTDPGVVTVLLQDDIGGLQVKYNGEWVDVKPVPGALVINVGDILQIMSNDEYKSVEHRVLANPHREPRVSIAVFFNPSDRVSLFGPLPELISSQKPAQYRQFTMEDYLKRFLSRELDGKSLANHYKL
ncbi:unnamed protein product [Dovyalis caffra]|uniref:Fe2OG dioxygenase domain-containing protein n=1 Tax=Dovyalis caffra TaxID=77055 RepID=A0AAV1R094_9ROSI|nr:unnamed protein product [Dovyalis caffra]